MKNEEEKKLEGASVPFINVDKVADIPVDFGGL